MKRMKDHLFPLSEAHVTLLFDGETLHADGLPDGPDSRPLPGFYQRGIGSIFHLLESMLPSLTCISIQGVWFLGEDAPFCAMDIWLQTQDRGFYLPMDSAALLFSRNGIPYFHKPPVIN